jgi:hypothetical protein
VNVTPSKVKPEGVGDGEGEGLGVGVGEGVGDGEGVGLGLKSPLSTSNPLARLEAAPLVGFVELSSRQLANNKVGKINRYLIPLL